VGLQYAQLHITGTVILTILTEQRAVHSQVFCLKGYLTDEEHYNVITVTFVNYCNFGYRNTITASNSSLDTLSYLNQQIPCLDSLSFLHQTDSVLDAKFTVTMNNSS